MTIIIVYCPLKSRAGSYGVVTMSHAGVHSGVDRETSSYCSINTVILNFPPAREYRMTVQNVIQNFLVVM
jgi:hypothetical protein